VSRRQFVMSCREIDSYSHPNVNCKLTPRRGAMLPYGVKAFATMFLYERFGLILGGHDP
jgi:hypothetical protein